MNQVERIADGKRRFFSASGVVSDVLVRDRKSHHDRGLERGRDYEVETGGVSLRSVPKQGTTIIILTGDREVGGPGSTPASSLGTSRTIVDRFAVQLPVPGLPDYSSSGVSIHAAADEESTARAESDQPEELVFTKDADGLTIHLDALKRCLVLATKDTNDATPRTPEWQDELARRTAVMLRADTLNGVKAAFMDIESYLRGD